MTRVELKVEPYVVVDWHERSSCRRPRSPLEMPLYRKPEFRPTREEGEAESCHSRSKTLSPIVMSGTSEGSEGFTTAPGSEKTSGDSTAPGTTLGGRAGMEMQGGKRLLPALREAARGFAGIRS